MRWFAFLLAVASTAGLARGETVAILPFANTSVPPTPGMDWLGASIAENVREALETRRIEVLGREEVAEAYATLRLRPMAELTQASILKLSEVLRVDHVLYGTFVYESSKLTIRGRILQRQDLSQTALEEIGGLEELAGLQAHLTWRVVAAIVPSAAPAEADYLQLRAPVRLDAEENYIRGLLASTVAQKEKYYLQAARLEPKYWKPAFELGKIAMMRKTYRDAAPWLERVLPTDAAYPEASFLLGVAKFQSGDTAAAQIIFQRLSETVPLGGVFTNLGAAQSRNGLAIAAEQFRRARETDPNDPASHFNLGYVLWKAGDFEAAAESFRAALDRDPDDTMATLLLGRSLTRQGPRKGAAADARLLALERIKESFSELGYSAFLRYRDRGLDPK